MYLHGIEGATISLVTRLSPTGGEETKGGVRVRSGLPLATPWRVVMISDAPGRLIESPLVLNLNEPNAIKDSSWIKPGKAAWDWWSGQQVKNVDFKTGMNDATMRHYIDFAHESNPNTCSLTRAGTRTNLPTATARTSRRTSPRLSLR